MEPCRRTQHTVTSIFLICTRSAGFHFISLACFTGEVGRLAEVHLEGGDKLHARLVVGADGARSR